MKPAATDWHWKTMSPTEEPTAAMSRGAGAGLASPPHPTSAEATASAIP
jgi:hypothetical protein